MKNLILTAFTAVLLLVSCDSGTIGKYKKEPLPDTFSYNVIEDITNVALEKNKLTLEINQKLTEGQIATHAEKLFNSKEKQRRFYIFYQLSGMKNGSGAWATSHFDPELDIQILGSTTQQDENANKVSKEQIDGGVIGKWREEQYTSLPLLASPPTTNDEQDSKRLISRMGVVGGDANNGKKPTKRGHVAHAHASGKQEIENNIYTGFFRFR